MGMNWKSLRHAKVFSRGSYLKPDGKYLLEIQKVYTISTRSKGSAFIVDFTVLESDHDEVKEGSTKNWFQSMQDEDIAFSAIKEFLLNLYDVDMSDEEEVEEFEEKIVKIMAEAADETWEKKPAEDHPMNGMKICVETWEKITEKNKKPFTVHNWSPAGE